MTDSESIRVTRSVVLSRSEIELRTSRSSGPGGQHAQKSETRVEAVFDVEASNALSDAQKRRVVAKAGPVLRAIAQDERSQLRNKDLATERLVESPPRGAEGAATPGTDQAGALRRASGGSSRRSGVVRSSGSGANRRTDLFDRYGLGEVARLVDIEAA